MPEKIKLPCSCRAVDPVPMERECGELATWFWQAYGGKLLRLLIKTTADNVYCGDGLSLATRLASIERTLGASTSMSFAANLAERDLLSRLNPGDRCYVFDASADPSIDEGGCMYMLMPDKSWKRLNEDARVDVEGLAGAGLAVSAEKLAVDWEKMPQETLAELLEQICGSGLAVADGLLAVRLASVSDADFCKKLEASIGRGLETGEDEDGRLALHVKLSDSVALADSETCASAVAVKRPMTGDS